MGLETIVLELSATLRIIPIATTFKEESKSMDNTAFSWKRTSIYRAGEEALLIA
jgi:hypothetical protein